MKAIIILLLIASLALQDSWAARQNLGNEPLIDQQADGYPCLNDNECYSSNCQADFTGKRYCASGTACVYDSNGDGIAEQYFSGQTPDDLHYCSDSKWKTCPTGLIINGQCCSQVPIIFSAPISESCRRSSIPVKIITACNVPQDTAIKLSIDNTIIRSDCRLSGDQGWAIDGSPHCELKIPDSIAPASHKITASYTIKNKPYTVAVSNPISGDGTFSIKAACDTNSQCSHVLFVLSPVSPSTVSVTPEYAVDGSSYVFPANAKVTMKNGQAYVMECSDGVVYSSTPGIVAWTYKDGNLIRTSNNNVFKGACTISGRDRTTLIGNVSDTKGFIPSNCDIGIHGAQSTEINLGIFSQRGHYSIKEDLIHAWCDSPDYICPWLGNDWRNSICRYGYANAPSRSTGWLPLKEYSFTVVEPLLVAVYEPREYTINASYEQGEKGMLASLRNAGTGRLKIGYIRYSCRDFECADPVYAELLDENAIQDVVFTANLANLTNISFSRYRYYDSIDMEGQNGTVQTIRLRYSLKANVSYDDAYGFSSIADRNASIAIPLSIARVCSDGFHTEQILNISSPYYCILNGTWQWSDKPSSGNTSDNMCYNADPDEDIDCCLKQDYKWIENVSVYENVTENLTSPFCCGNDDFYRESSADRTFACCNMANDSAYGYKCYTAGSYYNVTPPGGTGPNGTGGNLIPCSGIGCIYYAGPGTGRLHRHPLAEFATHGIFSTLGDKKYVEVIVRNVQDKTDTITVSLFNYKARFAEGGQTLSLSLNPAEEKKMTVILYPSDTGRYALKLNASSATYDMQDKDEMQAVVTFPVGFSELDEFSIILLMPFVLLSYLISRYRMS